MAEARVQVLLGGAGLLFASLLFATPKLGLARDDYGAVEKTARTLDYTER